MLRLFCFVVLIAEVTLWTVDLPEARKFIFEKNDRLEKMRKEDRKEKSFFSNRYYSNSKHHEKEEHGYAKEYGYQTYMEMSVRDIVYEGSEYLEGLKRSIDKFTELLENCTKLEQQGPQYFFNETAFNATAFNLASYNATPPTPSATPPWMPMNERAPYNESNVLFTPQRCRNATRASEHVRRLAALAITATRELKDIAYSKKHMKDDPHELSKAENEQILKLAWFLDRLAYYTDFKPDAKPYYKEDDEKRNSSTTPVPFVNSLVNATDDTKLMMMNCLKQKSEVPATIRCAYPQEIPSVVGLVLANSGPANVANVASSSNQRERVVDPDVATSEQEILFATDDRPYYHPYHPFHHRATITHVKKRSVTDMPKSLSLSKTSENPAITFMKYFVKHKVWEYDNPSKPTKKSVETFEVNNKLPLPLKIQKRDLAKKLYISEDPYQDLSKYVKNKKGVHFVKDEELAKKIRDSIEKIREAKTSAPKEMRRKIAKLFRYKRSSDDSEPFRSKITDSSIPSSEYSQSLRPKRSYTYETDVDEPRKPEDLFKDISYYVKNKPGTNYNRDFTQAAQLRASLEQIFLNPDIEVVRRYGSNYNPLIPNPLISGALRSALDN